MSNIIVNMFTIPELRKRLLFTIGMLFLFRLGAHLPVPGIDVAAIAAIESQNAQNGLLNLVNLFSGGALLRFSVFGLGIMPYISASIIMQLLTVVVPTLERLQKEGEAGRKKIQQYTRYGTVAIAALQGYGYFFILKDLQNRFPDYQLYPADSSLFLPGFVLAITVGTVFLMWIGEQITERGISNGISLLIFAGIVARLPQAVYQAITLVNQGVVNSVALIVLFGILLLVIGFVVMEQTGTRKIPVQYAKRVVGRKVYSGQATHIPFKINPSGVIPIIFASSVILFPAQIASFFTDSSVMQWITKQLDPSQSWFYYFFYSVLVVFFAYFYTAIQFNPNDIADNLKKNGGFIPGIRPGPNTAQFLERVLNRITLPGALFFAGIALFPNLVMLVPLFSTMPQSLIYLMGGTSLLIAVSVDLDLMKRIESHLLMRHYDGFLKKGHLKSGRTR